MPKRKKTTSTKPQAQKSKKKAATPENPSPEEPSAVSVNPAYDNMPDTIEDPAAVYKLAYLDMRRAALNNKLAIVAQEYDRRVTALNAERVQALSQAKAELEEAVQRCNAQKDVIEKTYGVALRSYTYDDETGVLKKQAVLAEEEGEEKRAEKDGGDTAEEGKTLH